MASNLRVDTILPSSGTTLGIGTANGTTNFTGNVGIAGTLTYEDVTNIDAVGLITARGGIKIGPSAGVAGTFFADGSYVTAGILTATNISAASSVTATTYYGSGAQLTGIDATQIVTGNTSVQTVDTGSDGHIKINIEGSERVRVGAAGSVGIGTDDPYSPLSIYGDTAAGTFINITSRTNTLAGINFGDFDDQDVGAIKYSNGSNTLRIFANSGERFRIGEAGQLGIGGATYGTAGQVLTSGGGSAAPTWGGAGKILQVVGSISQTATVISGTSPATTNLSQTITPSKTGSKMVVLFSGHYSQNHNGGSYGPQTKIYMYKKIGSGTDNQVMLTAYDYVANTNAVYHSHHYSASWYDQTGSTAGTDQKYTIYANLLYANHQMRFNPGGGYSQWTILEVA